MPGNPNLAMSGKSFVTLVSILVLAFAVNTTTPRAARADVGDLVGLGVAAGAAAVIYCGVSGKCEGGHKGGRSSGGGRGTFDAIALNKTQAMWVQAGLQNVGFYNGAIDGAIGGGTRASIRQYQAAIGEEATGALTGKQINDLVALSPTFLPYGADPIHMFNADLARDLDRDGIRQLQAALNSRGFNAGPVDGAFGGKTRTAITSYKAVNGLPGGGVPTRRLLAHLNGTPAPEPAGLMFAQRKPAGAGNVVTSTTSPRPVSPQPVPVAIPQPTPVTPAPAAQPVPMGGELHYDLVGVSLGMGQEQAFSILDTELGVDRLIETVPASLFGGTDVLSSATLSVQKNWPEGGAQQIMTLRDTSRPDLGVLAAFRLIHMPDGVDEAVFRAQILPGIIDKYGRAGMVSDSLTWIGKPEARAAANPAQLAACGNLRIASIANAASARDAVWSSGNGIVLDTASLASVTADCGDVLKVEYADKVIRIGLWNSTVLAQQVVVPQIKF